jgi:hypothetical protein
MQLERLRERLPLLAFLLLAVLCLAILGFVCACLADQPMQALERATAASALLPALIEVWAPAAAALLLAWAVFGSGLTLAPSPARLQRFLF